MLQPCHEAELCLNSGDLTTSLFNGNEGLFTNNPNGDRNFNAFVRKMERLHNGSVPKLRSIGLGSTDSSGMLSYPNGGGAHKSMMNPDVVPLALLMEQYSIDFRVLVLVRDPKAILDSVYNREFGGELEAKILIAAALQLYSQLLALDPAFYYCVDYDKFGDASPAIMRKLGDFLHPAIDDGLLQAMVTKFRPPTSGSISSSLMGRDNAALLSNSTVPLPYSRYELAQLYLHMDRIRQLCFGSNDTDITNANTDTN
jgi:hypothetical protein